MNPCLSGAPSGTNLLVDREGITKWKWHQTSTSSVLNQKRSQYRFSVTFKCCNTSTQVYLLVGQLGATTETPTGFFNIYH